MNEDISLTERYMLLAHVLGESFNKVQLMHRLGQLNLTEAQQNDYIQLLFRRMNGEPIQYITGYTDFYGRDFLCAPEVLIPRFDTECLVEAVLGQLSEGDKVLDLCCGSGCIGITLCLEKNVDVTLADISPHALALTKLNAEKFNAEGKTEIIRHDVLNEALDGRFSLIVSNPPYIRTSDMSGLSAEVRREPALALDGGEDGLIFYRRIISKYKENLCENGVMAFECGYDQARDVEALFRECGFSNIKIHKDYNNIERAVSAVLL